MSRPDRPKILGPGDVLGSYQLLAPIGAGGMGRVWVARRLTSPTPQYVAVKTALEELSGDAEFERVFIDEATIASSIVHPNVCKIYELGVERAIPYLVMEWVDGGSLHDILAATEGHRLEFRIAASIVARVCAGLHAAHELTDLDGAPMHVVHRDVSPQNILVSDQGHVKLADFGVARAKGQLHTPTQTGEFKGKLGYMAPEQLTTRTFDRRADVFALGCVLFQATTGQRPFRGNDALETMYRLLETDCERPSQVVADYPPELETIVLKALAKDVRSRFQTAEELETELSRFLALDGRPLSDRDIADLATQSLRESILRRREGLRGAIESVSILRAVAKRGRGRPEPHSRAIGVDPTPTLGATWESARPNASASPRARGMKPAAAYALMAIGVSAALIAFLVRQLPRNRPPAMSPAIAAPTATLPFVEIRFRAVPADALLELDQGTPTTSPLTLTTARSSAKHRLRVSRNGYSPEEREVVFDAPVNEVIELRPAVMPPVGAVATETTTISLAPSPAQKPPSVTPFPSSAKPVEATPTKSRKAKRPLDPTNPFSDP